MAKKKAKKKGKKKKVTKSKYNSALDMLCQMLLANRDNELTNAQIATKMGKAYPDNNACQQNGFINLTRRRLNEGFFARFDQPKKQLTEYDAEGTPVKSTSPAKKKTAKKKKGKVVKKKSAKKKKKSAKKKKSR